MSINIPKIRNYTQEELINGCIKGNRLCQKCLYEHFHGRMIAVCMRYTSSLEEAHDILHEGFIKVFNNLHLYQPTHPLESWIKRVMVNTAIDHYRKNKKYAYHVDIDNAYSCFDHDSLHFVSQLTADEIMQLVQKLSPAYRTVFNLYIVEGYTHREISEMLEISEGTSKSNLAKARDKLKTLLQKKFDYIALPQNDPIIP